MAKPLLYPVGEEALHWLLASGRPERAGPGHMLLQRWQAFWFEINLSAQRERIPLPSPPTDPLFVLGLWRSGTTLLHELLSSHSRLQFIDTWQSMHPSTFRLNSPPKDVRSMARPMDGMLIETHSPQEDEFALLSLGVPSVYRGFFDPRRLPELELLLQPSYWSPDEPKGWSRTWLDFLSMAIAEPKRRLILKSPAHTFRIAALKALFPHASYVWLVRDPIDTFHSNRKMWLAMFDRYALWKWDISILDKFLSTAIAFAAQDLSAFARQTPREQLVVLDFKTLVRDKVVTVKTICERLAIGDFNDSINAVEQRSKAGASHVSDHYESFQVPPIAIDALERLRVAQAAAVASHGL